MMACCSLPPVPSNQPPHYSNPHTGVLIALLNLNRKVIMHYITGYQTWTRGRKTVHQCLVAIVAQVGFTAVGFKKGAYALQHKPP
jgi:hypothetical protein